MPQPPNLSTSQCLFSSSWTCSYVRVISLKQEHDDVTLSLKVLKWFPTGCRVKFKLLACHTRWFMIWSCWPLQPDLLSLPSSTPPFHHVPVLTASCPYVSWSICRVFSCPHAKLLFNFPNSALVSSLLWVFHDSFSFSQSALLPPGISTLPC